MSTAPLTYLSRLAATATAALAVGVAPAQGLSLDVVGGSMPGTIEIALSPVQLLEGAVVAYSANAGPTALGLFQPGDPRSLSIGTDLLQDALVSTLVLGGVYRPPAITVPNIPSILDQPFHFQGVTFPGFPLLVIDISNPRTVWFGAAGTFRDRGRTFQNGRAFHSVLPRSDGSWMVAGGGIGALLAQSAQQDTEVYDPATDTFSPGPLLAKERAVHTTTQLLDGRWLLTAGVDRRNDPQVDCEIYDPVTDTFTAVAPLAQPRMGHTATLLADGRVIVAGGISNLNGPGLDPLYSSLRTTEIYDPATDQWTSGPNMRTPRVGHIAQRLGSGEVLFAGGASFDTIIFITIPALRRNSDLFDPATGQMRNGPTMNADRALPNLAPLGGGRYLVSGGISNIVLTPAPGATPTASAEIYDEASNSWSTTGSLSQARGLHLAMDMGNGRIMVAGGADGDVLSPVALASTEIFDDATGLWTAGPSLNQARAAFGAIVTPTGQWQVLGGGTGPTGAVTNRHESYYR